VRAFLLLSLLAAGLAASDIARVYASGSEPAKGNQTGGTPAQNGKELAHTGNSSNAHIYQDLAR
jgi:hypothetical protein